MKKKCLFFILALCLLGSMSFILTQGVGRDDICRLVIVSRHPELLLALKPGTYRGACGTLITLQATNNEKFRFDYWEGVDESLKHQLRIKIAVNRNMTIVAHFKEIRGPEMPVIDPSDLHVNPFNNKEQVENQAEDIKYKNIRNYNKQKVARGTPDQEDTLANYLFYFSGPQFLRVNWTAGGSGEVNINNPDSRFKNNNFYTTFIYPNEDETGNRYIAFYSGEQARPFSFIVYDKLLGAFDNNSFNDTESNYDGFTCLYPVDYPAGGDYIHTLFLAVYRKMVTGENREFIVIYEKDESGKVIRNSLVSNVIGHYYNPYQRILIWLKKNEQSKQLEFQVYDVSNDRVSPAKTIPAVPEGNPKLMFMAYGYFVIGFSDRSNTIRRVYNIDRNTPIEEFKNSKIFSASLHHNKGKFRLLFSGSSSLSGGFLHHKVYSQGGMSQGLLDGFLPESIIDTVKGPSGKNIKYILFPYVGNTYYMCVVERTSTGYMMKVDKLNDNFQRILSRCTVSALPGWLERSDPELYFEVSGSVITIQHEASGKNMGIAYLDNQGNVKFKPQI